MSRAGFDYDVIVVGSGFGGSVAALRLSEKAYKVAVLEAGRRFDAASLPRNSWDLPRYLWAPRLGLFGIQRLHLVGGVVVLAGAGVGGGSLNYANTLYEPPDDFFEDPQWAGPSWGSNPGWRSLLAPYYRLAKEMLGAARNPVRSPADRALEQVAAAMGASSSFEMAELGVLFGPPGAPPGARYPDPYFAGAGPDRRSCVHCGECMTGCRWGAKNTLPVNYLYLAERAGAVVLPMTTVVSLEPLGTGDGARGWSVGAMPTSLLWARRGLQPRFLTAEQVVLAAGTHGTQKLLHAMVLSGKLPNLSRRLGYLTRTNGESLVGATVPRGRLRPDFSCGTAITSSFWADPKTSVEPVRYGHGSNLMGLLGTLLPTQGCGHSDFSRSAALDGDRPGGHGVKSRLLTGVFEALASLQADPKGVLSFFDLRHWSERTVVALVMQALDGSLTLTGRRGPLGGVQLVREDGGELSQTWLPVAHEVARRLADVTGGRPARTWAEVFGLPMTAHLLGGCAMGASRHEGVVDPWHRAYGYRGLHIVDGSAVPANPGVNPALTITALAERAFAHWPNRGERELRPPIGGLPTREILQQVPAVPARWPVRGREARPVV